MDVTILSSSIILATCTSRLIKNSTKDNVFIESSSSHLPLIPSSPSVKNGITSNKKSNIHNTGSSSSIVITITLSFILFSLSIIEVLPNSSCILLYDKDRLLLKYAYKCILWINCTWILLKLSSALGNILTILEQWFVNMRIISAIVNFCRMVYTSILYMLICVTTSTTNYYNNRTISTNTLPTTTITKTIKTKSQNNNNGCFILKRFVLCILSSIINIIKKCNNNISIITLLCFPCSIILLRELYKHFFIILQSNNNIKNNEDDEIITSTLNTSSYLLQQLLLQITSLGLLLSCIVNGFCSVSFPHSIIIGMYHKPISDEYIFKAQNEIDHISTIIQEKKRLQYINNNSNNNTNTDNNNGMIVLSKEINYLEELLIETYNDIQEMKLIQSIVCKTNKITKKYERMYKLFGSILSFILLLRLLYSLSIITSGINNKRKVFVDPITKFLIICLSNNIVTIDQYFIYSQSISLVLSLFLIVSQTTSFINIIRLIVKRFFSYYLCSICSMSSHSTVVASTTTSLPSSSMHEQVNDISNSLLPFTTNKTTPNATDMMHQLSDDILCTCLGSYFLSCVIVLKLSIPNTYSNIFFSSFTTTASTTMPFQLNVYTMQSVFIISSIITIFLLGIIHRIHVSNSNVRNKYYNINHDNGIGGSGGVTNINLLHDDCV